VGLWHTVRREVAGAWRSARYDVDRVVGQHRAVRLRHAETKELTPREFPRRRYRMASTGGVVLLVAGGAAGTYLAVASSLSALRAPVDPDAPPIAAPAQPSSPIEFGTPSPGPEPKRPVAGRPGRRPAPAPVLANPGTSPIVVVTSTSRQPESTPTSSGSPSPSPSVTAPSTPSESPSQGGPGH
jgi:hypothetical protein